jgi:outer membrane protein OmpA-like peptidoglycan-associated protein
MAFIGNGGQPRDAAAFIQAVAIRGWLRSAPVRALVCAMSVVGCSIGGCSNNPTSGPVAWWHDAIGGKIAEQRPPPPGSNDPYPNLATVPARPPQASTAEWNQRTAGLVTDRIKADQAAALAPIPGAPTASTTAGTGLPSTGLPSTGLPSPAAPGQQPAASAALVGVTPPQVAPSRGPMPAGTSGSNGTAAGPPAPTNAAPGTAERVANGQLPALPGEAPSRPGIAPPRPSPLVPLTVTPPLPPPPVGAVVDFPQNSAALDDPALAEVKTLAASRGDHGIAVTGYGGATSSDPVVQSDALNLGLSRAQALATALVAQGVPFAMLRVNAEAAGRGASLRLLQ